mgnify:CR=1 FL=1
MLDPWTWLGIGGVALLTVAQLVRQGIRDARGSEVAKRGQEAIREEWAAKSGWELSDAHDPQLVDQAETVIGLLGFPGDSNLIPGEASRDVFVPLRKLEIAFLAHRRTDDGRAMLMGEGVEGDSVVHFASIEVGTEVSPFTTDSATEPAWDGSPPAGVDTAELLTLLAGLPPHRLRYLGGRLMVRGTGQLNSKLASTIADRLSTCAALLPRGPHDGPLR